MPKTKIEDGVFVDRKTGVVIVHLNTVNDTEGNGINLMPATKIEEPHRGRRSVAIRRTALKRMYEAMFEEENK